MSAGGDVANLKLGVVTGNVMVAGNIKTLAAGDVSGTIFASGQLGHAKVGNVTGSIVSSSLILSLTAASLTNAKIIAGDNLGSDGLFGGSGSAADSFAAGTIDVLHVNGAITGSFIAAPIQRMASSATETIPPPALG